MLLVRPGSVEVPGAEPVEDRAERVSAPRRPRSLTAGGKISMPLTRWTPRILHELRIRKRAAAAETTQCGVERSETTQRVVGSEENCGSEHLNTPFNQIGRSGYPHTSAYKKPLQVDREITQIADPPARVILQSTCSRSPNVPITIICDIYLLRAPKTNASFANQP